MAERKRWGMGVYLYGVKPIRTVLSDQIWDLPHCTSGHVLLQKITTSLSGPMRAPAAIGRHGGNPESSSLRNQVSRIAQYVAEMVAKGRNVIGGRDAYE
jgi:hypothetical protein